MRPQHCTVDDEEEALWCLDGEVLHRLAAGERAGEATQVLVGAGCASSAPSIAGRSGRSCSAGTSASSAARAGGAGGGPMAGSSGWVGSTRARRRGRPRPPLDRALVRTAAGRLLALDVADPDTHLLA
ncbi:MAG: hypothetical protein R3F43_05625 [bacterium]